MTKLEKLYQTIQNLKELGLPLDERLIKETEQLEEEIIQKGNTTTGACLLKCRLRWYSINNYVL